MAIIKAMWKNEKGDYVAIIDLGQTEIAMKEDKTVPPGILVPPKQSEDYIEVTDGMNKGDRISKKAIKELYDSFIPTVTKCKGCDTELDHYHKYNPCPFSEHSIYCPHVYTEACNTCPANIMILGVKR